LGVLAAVVISPAWEDDKARPKAWGELLALGIGDGEEAVDCLCGVLVPSVSEYSLAKERGCTNPSEGMSVGNYRGRDFGSTADNEGTGHGFGVYDLGQCRFGLLMPAECSVLRKSNQSKVLTTI
jgi:hypothetical protein